MDLVAHRLTGRPDRRHVWLVLATVLTLAIAACGGSSSPSTTPSANPPPPAATSATASTPTPRPAPEVGRIVWATSIDPTTEEPREVVDGFAADDLTIYAVLPVRNLPPTAVLTANWTYNGTSLERLATTAVAPSGPNAGWVEFHLTRSGEPWPSGTYSITISFDGKVVQSAETTVKRA